MNDVFADMPDACNFLLRRRIIAGIATLVTTGGTQLFASFPSETGAVTRTSLARTGEFVSVDDFGAIGNGRTNDWAACQKAHDYLESLGGGVLYFTPGKTYRIVGNTILIWGSNIKVVAYGATIYKDAAGAGAGTYGDAVTFIGKLDGLAYYSPAFSGNYSSAGIYSGPNVLSKNCSMEGGRIRFGTHDATSINGVSGLNFDGLSIKHVQVIGAPQTGFAFAADRADCLSLHLEGLLSDGAGTQGYRIQSQSPSPGKVSGGMFQCVERRTGGTIAPFPEQNGLAASAFIRGSGSDVPFDWTVEECDFAAPLHLYDGYKGVTIKGSSVGYVLITNASPECVNIFDRTRFKTFATSAVSSGFTSNIFARNTYVGAAKLVLRNCIFPAPAAGRRTVANYGFDLIVEHAIGGPLSYYHVAQTTYRPSFYMQGGEVLSPDSARPTAGRP